MSGDLPTSKTTILPFIFFGILYVVLYRMRYVPLLALAMVQLEVVVAVVAV